MYAQCGGPEPREQGCGADLWLRDPRAVMENMQGHGILGKCTQCGVDVHLVPAPDAPLRMSARPAPPDAMMERIMRQIAGGNGKVDPVGPPMGLIGPNGKPWGKA